MECTLLAYHIMWSTLKERCTNCAKYTQVTIFPNDYGSSKAKMQVRPISLDQNSSFASGLNTTQYIVLDLVIVEKRELQTSYSHCIPRQQKPGLMTQVRKTTYRGKVVLVLMLSIFLLVQAHKYSNLVRKTKKIWLTEREVQEEVA